jgi:hypothetical protein
LFTVAHDHSACIICFLNTRSLFTGKPFHFSRR